MKQEEYKVCGDCKRKLPKTSEYFHERSDFFVLKNGKKKKTKGLRSVCKSCHHKKTEEKRRLKRIEELSCTKETYKKYWTNEISKKRLKHKQLEGHGLNNSKLSMVSRFIDENPDYNYTNYDQFLKDRSEIAKENILNGHINTRKYDYKKNNYLTIQDKNEMYMKVLPRAIVANRLGFKVNELTHDVYETYKNIVNLKRELGMTHSSISSRNK